MVINCPKIIGDDLTKILNSNEIWALGGPCNKIDIFRFKELLNQFMTRGFIL